MLRFRQIFPSKCSIIGMIHAGALPGSPNFEGSVNKIVDKALRETEIYLNNDINGILVENMNDIPYIKSKHFGPEIVSTMTRICTEVRKIVPKTIPCGVQILAGGNLEAIAVAKISSFNFIRSEGFVFSHIADEGFMDAEAGLILRYRKNINANGVAIWTDIKKKHSSHSITNDLSLVETAKAAEFFLSDGIILTGTATGSPADVQELKDLKSKCELPIIVGSGVNDKNVHQYLKADALIIGSHFKTKGQWQENVCNKRVQTFMNDLKYLQSN